VIAGEQGKDPRTKEYKEARAAYHGFLLCLHLFQVLAPTCGSEFWGHNTNRQQDNALIAIMFPEFRTAALRTRQL
jgi:hypothetical protein